jgi:hypothetical protein
VSIEDLDQPTLARLGREWLLHGHLQDRAGMPLVLSKLSRSDMEQIAIDEWMAASPIYSRRMQQALRFEGDGVDTIFKNLQLDVGAPHQFMDFQYQLDSSSYGEFWLAHCGALMDVEPMGEEFVVGMCHHIEDPTFDATAAATNRHAQVRPIHRPPRVPADRHPHCHWTVSIDPSAPAVVDHPNVVRLMSSAAAGLPVVSASAEGGYAGDFDPAFTLESLPKADLLVALREFAIQCHLLFGAYLLAVESRLGYDSALAMGHQVLVGLGGITASRLAAEFDPDLAGLFDLHPLLHPEDYDPAGDPYSYRACLDRHGNAPLDAIARAVDPGARARLSGGRLEIELGHPPVEEPKEMALVRFSTGADFRFRT